MDCVEVLFVMQCSSVKREEMTDLPFTHSKINLKCKLKCSMEEKKIALQAVLGYVPTVKLSQTVALYRLTEEDALELLPKLTFYFGQTELQYKNFLLQRRSWEEFSC